MDLFLGLSYVIYNRDKFYFKSTLFNTACSTCRPSESTVSEDAGIEPKLVGDCCDFGIGIQTLYPIGYISISSALGQISSTFG
jgi:hypothetical protein